jgi:hypothetical protein
MMSYVKQVGIGTTDEANLINENNGYSYNSPLYNNLHGNILLANTPQLMLAAIYFTYESVFTAMCSAVEWSRFARQRKGLRVSSTPVGSQRRTYFLQLPYRYGIPLLVVSATLQWLASQTLYFVKIETTSPTPPDSISPENWYTTDMLSYNDRLTCGWSPLGVFIFLIIGLVLVLFLPLWSLRRLPTAMPVAASCSAAIAAACHPHPWADKAWEKPVMWGVQPSIDTRPMVWLPFHLASLEESNCATGSEWKEERQEASAHRPLDSLGIEPQSVSGASSVFDARNTYASPSLHSDAATLVAETSCRQKLKDLETMAGAMKATAVLEAWKVVDPIGPVQHCSFSSREVSYPMKGQLYH